MRRDHYLRALRNRRRNLQAVRATAAQAAIADRIASLRAYLGQYSSGADETCGFVNVGVARQVAKEAAERRTSGVIRGFRTGGGAQLIKHHVQQDGGQAARFDLSIRNLNRRLRHLFVVDRNPKDQ